MGSDNSVHVLVQHCCHFTEVQAEIHEANLPDKLMLIIFFIFNPLKSRVFLCARARPYRGAEDLAADSLNKTRNALQDKWKSYDKVFGVVEQMERNLSKMQK